ncbi:hypothetical protein HK405_012541 [Cladochytrium tenue]|nr:hypothetical protein HK405_012541 [Cladochytrium tenue]
MPSLLSLRNICDRLKSLSADLVLTANMSGELALRAETDIASVEIQYRDLINPELGMVQDHSVVIYVYLVDEDPAVGLGNITYCRFR